MVLGLLLVQGNRINAVHAQSIPVLPPLAPASLDVEELGLDEDADLNSENSEDGTEVGNSETDGADVLTDIPAIDDDESTIDLDVVPVENEGSDPSEVGTEAVDKDVDALEDSTIEEPSPDGIDLDEPSLDETPLVEDSDEPFDTDLDGALEDELGDLEEQNEPLVDDLDVDAVTPGDFPLEDPATGGLNGVEDLLPIEGRDSGDPIPTQVETFKPRQGVSIFEDVVLTPNVMTNPTTLRGISGGPLTASRVAGRTDTATGICTGFVDRKPDHRIELTAFFDYLSLQVESPEDTVLVVRGPGGSWCNDDVLGFNPGLAGEWFSGMYDVWVGSYNEETYHPYVIRLSDSQ